MNPPQPGRNLCLRALGDVGLLALVGLLLRHYQSRSTSSRNLAEKTHNNDTSLLGTIPNGINNNGLDTPNVAPGALNVNTNPGKGKPAFNTALFSLPSLGQLGDTRRRYFDGPGMDNFDTALQKGVRLTEAKSLEFRVEVFNAFNHPQFFGPAAVDGDISSASFGRIVNAASPRLAQLAARFVF